MNRTYLVSYAYREGPTSQQQLSNLVWDAETPGIYDNRLTKSQVEHIERYICKMIFDGRIYTPAVVILSITEIRKEENE